MTNEAGLVFVLIAAVGVELMANNRSFYDFVALKAGIPSRATKGSFVHIAGIQRIIFNVLSEPPSTKCSKVHECPMVGEA
ncbi:hypothetical protein RUESEDTHA_01871 [Ruegeria sp. THAF57]|uniref:hypothetical protein n=1 Tax=Ruegeria sp. THAF57 TaxID=2744555 RepID=UPI0015DF0DA5|nr:hypothetical protein [Ruegeria sp. THAF57]CAD0184987.1 hypothetical protein RUESEDTHA_01871 [Ruegeria sp. THAF57]